MCLRATKKIMNGNITCHKDFNKMCNILNFDLKNHDHCLLLAVLYLMNDQ